MKKLTAKTIAKELNISPSTVSRVLNNSGKISDETKKNIYSYIRKHDPDSIYLFQNNNKRIVGLVVSKLSNEFFAKITEQIEKLLSRYNISLIIKCTNYSFEEEKAAIYSLIDNKVQCIITLATRHKVVNRSELNNIPIISIDESDPIIDSVPDVRVWCDQYIGGVLASEELVSKGCKQIIFMTNIAPYFKDYKYKGYCDTIKKHNLTIDNRLLVTSGNYSTNSIKDAELMTEYLLTKGVKFDGVFATSDRRALGVMIALDKHNIKYPEDVKIIGYDASTLSESFGITSIYQDINNIAENCVINILKYFNEHPRELVYKSPIPVFLKKGTTT